MTAKVRVLVRKHTRALVRTCSRVYTLTYTHGHARAHTHGHARAHTHTHTHTAHAPSCSTPPPPTVAIAGDLYRFGERLDRRNFKLFTGKHVWSARGPIWRKMFRDSPPTALLETSGAPTECSQELGGPVEVSDDSQPPNPKQSLRQLTARMNTADADDDNDSQGTKDALANSRPSRYDEAGLKQHREEVKTKRAQAKAAALDQKIAEAREVAREADETFDMKQHDPRDGRKAFLQPPRDKSKSFHAELDDIQKAVLMKEQARFNEEMDTQDALRQKRDRELAERMQAEGNGDRERLKNMDYDDKKRSASPDPDAMSPPHVVDGGKALLKKWDQSNKAAEQEEAKTRRDAKRRAADHIASLNMCIAQKVAKRNNKGQGENNKEGQGENNNEGQGENNNEGQGENNEGLDEKGEQQGDDKNDVGKKGDATDDVERRREKAKKALSELMQAENDESEKGDVDQPREEEDEKEDGGEEDEGGEDEGEEEVEDSDEMHNKVDGLTDTQVEQPFADSQ